MARVTIQDALEYCLVNPDGLGVEELLAKFPEYRAELAPLLALAASVGGVSPVLVPAERRAAMKTRVMEAAAAQSQAQQVKVVQDKSKARTPWAMLGWIVGLLRKPAFAVAGLLSALIVVLWWGAASALPGSPLYSVKLASENAALNFAAGAGEKARDHLGLASRRLDDIETAKARGSLAMVDGAVKNFADHMSNATNLWKETTDGENGTIKSSISGVVSRFELLFRDFDGEVATLPKPVIADITQVYSGMLEIKKEIGELPYLQVPPGIILPITPVPTPVAPEPTGAVPTEVVTEIPVKGISTTTATAIDKETPEVEPSATVPPLGTRVATVAEPTARPTSGVAAKVTATSTRVVGATPSAQSTRTRVASITNTSTPTTTSTSIVPVVSATPGVEETATGTSTPTRQIVASPTSTVQVPAITATFVIPSPALSTTTVEPPGIRTVEPTEVEPSHVVPTHVPPDPTSEACVLHIDEVVVEASCITDGDVNWSANVENSGSTSEDGDWVATLSVKGSNGGFQEVDKASGSETIPARGSATIEGTFSHVALAGSKSVRVQLTMTQNGSCRLNKQSTMNCK